VTTPLPNQALPGAWVDRAACRDEDPRLFFAPADSGTRTGWTAWEARSVCHHCPVAVQCFRFAVATGERWGVWGGVDMAQLARVARGTRVAP